jgi:hypothetical protein
MMNPPDDYRMTEDQRKLLTDLYRSDDATQGRPQLPAEAVEQARDYLAALVVDGDAERAHITRLEELYRAKYCCPLERWFWQGEPRPPHEVALGFRHNRFLPEEKARAVAERGPGILSADELAALLLNPYAVRDLADLVEYLYPDHWAPLLRQKAQENWERHNYNIPIPGLDEPERGPK